MSQDKSEAVTQRQYSQGYPRGLGFHLALKNDYLEDVGDNIGVRDPSEFLDRLSARKNRKSAREGQPNLSSRCTTRCA